MRSLRCLVAITVALSTEAEDCESGYTIAMLANFDPPAASRIAMRLVRDLPKSAGCPR